VISKICLHGSPDCAPGHLKMIEVQPYEGRPRPEVDVSFNRTQLPCVPGLVVEPWASHFVIFRFYYNYTDEHGIPHYFREIEQ
jgi:hypothetical protein